MRVLHLVENERKPQRRGSRDSRSGRGGCSGRRTRSASTVAFERWISCDANGCQRPSTAGPEPELVRRRRNGAGGKHDDGAAFRKMSPRCGAGGQVRLLGSLGAGEIDWQDERAPPQARA